MHAPLPGWCSPLSRERHVEAPRPTCPTHPVAGWVAALLQEAGHRPVPCPRCGQAGPVAANLDHLLGQHGAGYAEAAAWLEEADPDLFALAIHCLAAKARSSRSP